MFSDGYFPRGQSMLRRVMEEKCVGLMYGQRALCIGALKPLNFVGTIEHSHHRATPFKRLAHTGAMFERVYFGTKAEADATLKAVAGMHRRVTGVLPEDAGPHSAGTPYDAMDPELMLWTVANIVDSAAWFYEQLVRPLAPDEAEAFWQDWVLFGELFGLPRERVPDSWPAFRAWFAGELAGDDLHLTDEAHYMGYMSAFEIPLPASRQMPKRLHDALMLYSLPERVRELYGLRLTDRDRQMAERMIAVHRRVRPLMPGRVALGSCIPEFEMVAATERRRIEEGRWTPAVGGRFARGERDDETTLAAR
jgi:uncharacterized protein (DUF2236 family)